MQRAVQSGVYNKVEVYYCASLSSRQYAKVTNLAALLRASCLIGTTRTSCETSIPLRNAANCTRHRRSSTNSNSVPVAWSAAAPAVECCAQALQSSPWAWTLGIQKWTQGVTTPWRRNICSRCRGSTFSCHSRQASKVLFEILCRYLFAHE